jgi:electron transport complex protein RnfA
MMMSEYLLLLLSTILVNNFVLVQFLGLCPLMGTSKKLTTAAGLAAATTFVLTLSSILSYGAYALLLHPFQLDYLYTITFILVIAVTVQFTEMVLHKTSPMLYRVLGIYLPLITTNCIVLGVALLNVRQAHPTFINALLTGVGSGLGFALVLILFALLRERINVADVPKAFRGNAIAMITAGLMSLSFMGFAGLVKF